MNIKNTFSFLSQFLSGQLLLQFFNLLNGFFLLRWLSIQEQAKFSVAFSIQSLVISLSDLGFTGSILALVGNRIYDKKVVGAYIQTAKRLRNYLFFFSCVISLFIVPIIIKEQSWGYSEMALILAPVLLAVFWQADCSLYDSTLVMHQKMKDLYKPQVGLAAVKFGTNFILHLFGYIGAFSTLLLNAFIFLINGQSFKKAAKPYVEFSNTKNENEFKEMLIYLKPLIPGLVFNSIYSQVQIFLISFFGKSTNIAEIAALGRLSQIFLFLSSINGVLVAPYIAKSNLSNFKKKYFIVVVFSLFISLLTLTSVMIIPNFFLFIIGPKYAHLKMQLPIMILNSCLSYIAGVLWTLHSAKKWLFWWGSWSYILIIIILQIIGINLFDISTTKGVLQMSTLTMCGILFNHILTAIYGFNKLKILSID